MSTTFYTSFPATDNPTIDITHAAQPNNGAKTLKFSVSATGLSRASLYQLLKSKSNFDAGAHDVYNWPNVNAGSETGDTLVSLVSALVNLACDSVALEEVTRLAIADAVNNSTQDIRGVDTGDAAIDGDTIVLIFADMAISNGQSLNSQVVLHFAVTQ